MTGEMAEAILRANGHCPDDAYHLMSYNGASFWYARPCLGSRCGAFMAEAHGTPTGNHWLSDNARSACPTFKRKPDDLPTEELYELWTYVGSAVHDAIMCNDGGHQDTAGEHIGALTDAERARAIEALERVLRYVRRAEGRE